VVQTLLNGLVQTLGDLDYIVSVSDAVSGINDLQQALAPSLHESIFQLLHKQIIISM